MRRGKQKVTEVIDWERDSASGTRLDGLEQNKYDKKAPDYNFS